MVVNTFSCFFSNTLLQLSWSCQENQVSGAWNSMSLYGTGKSFLQKRHRGASQSKKHLDVDFKELEIHVYADMRQILTEFRMAVDSKKISQIS